MFRPSISYRVNPMDANPARTVRMMLLLMLAVLVWIPVQAQTTPEGAIEIEPGGKVWIEGSASIVDYTCTARRLSGNGSIKNTKNPQQNIKGHGDVSVAVTIPVRLLDCGKKKMNNDMYEALKAKRHKSITYQLIDAHMIEADSATTGDDGWMDIETTGILKIAGVENRTDVIVQGKLISDNRFRVKGSKRINMKTYDIEPPTALLGLIKASDELVVHFDVTVRLTNAISALAPSSSLILELHE